MHLRHRRQAASEALDAIRAIAKIAGWSVTELPRDLGLAIETAPGSSRVICIRALGGGVVVAPALLLEELPRDLTELASVLAEVSAAGTWRLHEAVDRLQALPPGGRA